jgi:hypothetical protein
VGRRADNWWGHASGPSAPSNPGGQGDPVAAGAQASHVYQAVGSYTVTVTAVNGAGSQTATITVNVNATFYRIYLPAVLRP